MFAMALCNYTIFGTMRAYWVPLFILSGNFRRSLYVRDSGYEEGLKNIPTLLIPKSISIGLFCLSKTFQLGEQTDKKNNRLATTNKNKQNSIWFTHVWIHIGKLFCDSIWLARLSNWFIFVFETLCFLFANHFLFSCTINKFIFCPFH